ncbi:DNA polymerase III subunit delta' [Halioxenophilus sp. WMMB6]|uniref:DNA polymerase III subunit delta' n=1 Tax=Halioxenophilus sp. WMMB6 TaxID=3073815 RepID=UPI00295F3541|nr:DNA polymerase III subunit delta' [Halioxenophilus sp. WMMB6]
MSSSTEIIVPYPWQQGIWQRLNQQRSQSKLPHATLFAGVAGVGKENLAKALAQLLLCQAPEHDLACGSCKSCLLLQAQTHPDYHLVMPEPGKQIKIEEIRILQESLTKSAQQGGSKVVVMGPVESLNSNAANAFLKTLEEPTSNTFLVLFSHQISGVMPTIRSRCQIQQLGVPDLNQSREWLSQIAGERAQTLLDTAAGIPLKALALLDADTLETRHSVLLLLQKLEQQQLGPVACAGQLKSYSLETICLLLTETMEKRIRTLYEREEANSSQPLAQALLQLRGKVVRLLERLRRGSNPNQQLALEEVLIDYSRVFTVRMR